MTDVRRCSSCRERNHLDTQEFCDRCEWLQAIGVLVASATVHTTWSARGLGSVRRGVPLAALEAIAFLLHSHAKERADYRREVNEAVRDGQLDARGAYSQGYTDAVHARDW